MDLAPSSRSNESLRRFDVVPTDEATERSLALVRLWMAGGTMVLLLLDPLASGLPPSPGIGYAVGYTAYSLLILLLLRNLPECSHLLRRGLITADLFCAALFPFFAPESRIGLSLLLLFLLVSSAERWGLGGVIKTAATIAVLLIGESALLGSAIPARGLSTSSSRFEYHLIPVLFALITGGLLGFRVQRQKERRWETAARSAESERARIAREIHDRAIQVLYAVDSRLEALKHRRPSSPAAILKDLGVAQQLLRMSTDELRELVLQAKPLDLGSKTFLEYVADLVEEFRQETGIAARFISDGDRISIPPAVAHELIRIVQEALVNIRKHSGAKNVLIRFTSQSGCMKFIIDDDGRGFDFAGRLSLPELTATRRGPAVIRERVSTLGGDLSIESTPGRGARLEIDLSQEAYG